MWDRLAATEGGGGDLPHRLHVGGRVLGEQVKVHLAYSILNGRYSPGSRIVATGIARELGVSQAPVREAIRDLMALGLIDAAPHKGSWVRQPAVQEIVDAFAVRAEVEAMAARQALRGVVEFQLDELTKYLGEMRRGARLGEPNAQAIAHVLFHRHIVQMPRNTALARTWRLLEPYSGSHAIVVGSYAQRTLVADLHQPILDALRARDEAHVRQAIDEHYTQAAAMLVESTASESNRARTPDDAQRGAGDTLTPPGGSTYHRLSIHSSAASRIP